MAKLLDGRKTLPPAEELAAWDAVVEQVDETMRRWDRAPDRDSPLFLATPDVTENARRIIQYRQQAKRLLTKVKIEIETLRSAVAYPQPSSPVPAKAGAAEEKSQQHENKKKAKKKKKQPAADVAAETAGAAGALAEDGEVIQ